MSSALNALRAALEAAALTAWTGAGYSRNTISFGNTHFDPAGLAIWARMTVRYGSTFLATQATVGSGAVANTTVGAVMIQVFTAAGSGTGDAVTAADALRDAFDRKVISTAQMMAASVGEAPDVDSEDQGWAMVTVTTTFEYDESI